MKPNIKKFLFGLCVLSLCVITIFLFNSKREKETKLLDLEEKLKNLPVLQTDALLELENRYKYKIELLEVYLLDSKRIIEELLSTCKQERVSEIEIEQEFSDRKQILAMNSKDATREELTKTGRGKVLIIDKESGSVVVSLGRKDNLSAGTTLFVYRNELNIARLEVIKVEENYSVATLFPSWRSIEIIKEGDLVKFSK
jgi:hypothetical protein